MRALRRFLLALIPVVLVIAGGLFVRSRIIEAKKPPDRKPAANAEPLVDVVAVNPSNVAPPVTAFGTVEAGATLPIVSEVSGKVVAMKRPLRPGVEVAAGDVLWELDSTDYDIAIRRIEAELDSLRATVAKIAENQRSLRRRASIAKDLLKLAENDLGRYDALKRKGAVSDEAYDRALATVRQRSDAYEAVAATLSNLPHDLAETKAMEADAKARLEQAKLNRDRATVKAPFDGRVVDGSLDVGMLLGPGKAAITLEDTSHLEVSAPFTLQKLRWAATDAGARDRAVIRPRDASPEGPVYSARLVRTGGPIDPRTQTQSLVFRVDRPKTADLLSGAETLAPGMFVSVELPGVDVPGAVALPRRALRDDGSVVAVADGKLAFRQVVLVRDGGNDVIVRGDLAGGDLVLINPPKDAVEGRAVRVRQPAPVVTERQAAADPLEAAP